MCSDNECYSLLCISVFFNDTATTEIYTLSLHDALPICRRLRVLDLDLEGARVGGTVEPRPRDGRWSSRRRSEEHKSELQSRQYLVCRLLLEQKNTLHLTPYLVSWLLPGA